jgi:phage baseplate assembly protein W
MARILFKGFSTQPDREKTRNWSVYDIDLIKADLLNHFYTKKKERVMFPNFGSIIWDKLMEPLTDTVKQEIIEDTIQLVESDTRVKLQSINAIEIDRGIRIELSLLYVPLNAVDSFNVDFDRSTQDRV